MSKTYIDFDYLKPLIYDYLFHEYGYDLTEKPSACPICNQGHNTPCFSVKPDTKDFKCFSCGESGDVLNLIQKTKGLSITEARDYLIENYLEFNPADPEGEPIRKYETASADPTYKTASGIETDFTDFISECSNNLNKTDYLLKRGIPTEIAVKHRIGYAERWTHPKAKTAYYSPRLIIPSPDNKSYLARDTRSDLSEAQQKYKKMRAGAMKTPFNASEITRNTNTPLYIVEGEINAMSLETIGHDSIAVGSVSNYKMLLKYLQGKTVTRPLVLMLDNDQAGTKNQQLLYKGLQELKLTVFNMIFPFTSKDINDVLTENKEGLINAMSEINKTVESLIKEKEPEADLTPFQRFLEKIKSEEYKPVPTHFKALDRALGGGLYSGGLTVIASSPSEGKSSLSMQICENIAEYEHRNILVFSFEMNKDQLYARAVSRFSFEQANTNEFTAYTSDHAVNSLQVLQGFNWDQLSGAQQANMKTGIERYLNNIEKYVTIFDQCEPTTDAILEQIAQFEADHPTDKPPIVLIDYLQLLDSDGKEFVSGCKDITLALKRYAIKRDTSVIAISSINREGQRNGASMTSLYGSSFAEYGTDTLLMIDFTDLLNHLETDKNTLKNQFIRDITITIQKNRMSATGTRIRFAYVPAFNYFTDDMPEKLLAEEVEKIENRSTCKRKNTI